MKPQRTPAILIGLLLVGAFTGCSTDAPDTTYVMTVSGPIAPHEMGATLTHEHVLVDFAGAEIASPERYDRQEAFEVALPHLEQIRALGFRTLIEATPAYLGRDPLLLVQLSEASGAHLLANTGYYAARDEQHLPRFAFDDSADSLAARWIREWETGLDGTGVRPGFIKIGVEGGPLTDVELKLIQAAARTHLRTGLTIASHTGLAAAALDQLIVLAAEGVDPSAWIWVHAQAENDSTVFIDAARSGAWVSFDGLAPENVGSYVALVELMKAEGLLNRVLLSHDAGWYHVGEPGGGTFRPYDTLITALLPALETAGFTSEEIHQLTVVNPADAFAVRVRARSP